MSDSTYQSKVNWALEFIDTMKLSGQFEWVFDDEPKVKVFSYELPKKLGYFGRAVDIRIFIINDIEVIKKQYEACKLKRPSLDGFNPDAPLIGFMFFTGHEWSFNNSKIIIRNIKNKDKYDKLLLRLKTDLSKDTGDLFSYYRLISKMLK